MTLVNRICCIRPNSRALDLPLEQLPQRIVTFHLIWRRDAASFPSKASLNSSLCKSTRCIAINGTPYRSAASLKLRLWIWSNVVPSTDSHSSKSWPLRRGLPNSLYDHLADRARWAFGLCMWKLATSTWASVRCSATWSSSHVNLLFVSIASRCSISIDMSICLFGNL